MNREIALIPLAEPEEVHCRRKLIVPAVGIRQPGLQQIQAAPSWLVGKGPSAWSPKDCLQEHGIAHPISPGIRPVRSRFIAATLIFTQASTFARPRQGTLAVRDFNWAFLRSTRARSL